MGQRHLVVCITVNRLSNERLEGVSDMLRKLVSAHLITWATLLWGVDFPMAAGKGCKQYQQYMTQLKMFQKVEYGRGPIFKVVLEC